MLYIACSETNAARYGYQRLPVMGEFNELTVELRLRVNRFNNQCLKAIRVAAKCHQSRRPRWLHVPGHPGWCQWRMKNNTPALDRRRVCSIHAVSRKHQVTCAPGINISCNGRRKSPPVQRTFLAIKRE